MDALHNKVEIINKLYKNISKYSNDISQFHKYELDVETNIPDDIDNINICIKNIEKLYTYLENYTLQSTKNNNKIYSNIFEFYNLINFISYKIDNILCALDKIASSNSKELTYNISDAEIESIGNLYNNIKLLYNKYQTDTIAIDIDIFQYIYSILSKDNWGDTKIIDIVEILNETIKLYPFAINLYAFIMQKILHSCIPLGNDVCNTIINNIELIKNFILLESIKVNLNNKTIVKSNPHIKTFGLTPSGSLKPLSKLVLEIDNNIKDCKLESNLGTLAKSKDVCVILVNRIISKPLEFSLWSLIDWNVSKSFIQGEFAGVNKTIIDRFRTIMFIDIKKQQKWDFSINYYGDINADYLIIIEKLATDAYRLLHIYNRESDFYKKTGGGTYETKIHKTNLTSFIEYVKNNGITPMSTRISEYHKIQERKILENMFLPIKFNMAGINMSSQIVDSKYLRYELHTKLTNEFTEIIKKEYKDGTLIKTNKDIGVIIHHKNLYTIFNSIIIEQYDIYTFKNKENVSPFPFSETIKTFLAKLSLLNRSFIRGVHGKFTEIDIDQSIFSDNISKKIYLNKLFNDIITPVLEKLISNESNVYQSLIYKNSLLKLSVY